MNSTRLKRLKAAGWKIGTTKDYLDLTDQEAALIEVKLSLIDTLKRCRQKRRFSQGC
jgi:hypothetical protein